MKKDNININKRLDNSLKINNIRIQDTNSIKYNLKNKKKNRSNRNKELNILPKSNGCNTCEDGYIIDCDGVYCVPEKYIGDDYCDDELMYNESGELVGVNTSCYALDSDSSIVPAYDINAITEPDGGDCPNLQDGFYNIEIANIPENYSSFSHVIYNTDSDNIVNYKLVYDSQNNIKLDKIVRAGEYKFILEAWNQENQPPSIVPSVTFNINGTTQTFNTSSSQYSLISATNNIFGNYSSYQIHIDFTVDYNDNIIVGCSNSNACNYEQTVTFDDGRCENVTCNCLGNNQILTVNMCDSYGDGWNGTQLKIIDIADDSENNITIIDGFSKTSLICIDPNKVYHILCEGGLDIWHDEISWEILNSNGGIVIAGGAPFDGYFSINNTEIIFGCMDENASNYNSEADYSTICYYGGATSKSAYNITALNKDINFEKENSGSENLIWFRYTPEESGILTITTADSGNNQLIYTNTGNINDNINLEFTDLSAEILVTKDTLLYIAVYQVFINNSISLNFTLGITGCMNQTADNYNSNANINDGSCSFSGEPITIKFLSTDLNNNITITNSEGEQFIYQATVGYNETDIQFDLVNGVYSYNTNKDVLIQTSSVFDHRQPQNIFYLGGLGGCTDSNNCNYNSNAMYEDNSCFTDADCKCLSNSEKSLINISFIEGVWLEEVSWRLLDLSNNVLIEGNISTIGNFCVDKQENDIYKLEMNDSYGDGWNGTQIIIKQDTKEVKETLKYGITETQIIYLGTESIILGCMNPDALNYNSAANIDDDNCLLGESVTNLDNNTINNELSNENSMGYTPLTPYGYLGNEFYYKLDIPQDFNNKKLIKITTNNEYDDIMVVFDDITSKNNIIKSKIRTVDDNWDTSSLSYNDGNGEIIVFKPVANKTYYILNASYNNKDKPSNITIETIDIEETKIQAADFSGEETIVENQGINYKAVDFTWNHPLWDSTKDINPIIEKGISFKISFDVSGSSYNFETKKTNITIYNLSDGMLINNIKLNVIYPDEELEDITTPNITIGNEQVELINNNNIIRLKNKSYILSRGNPTYSTGSSISEEDMNEVITFESGGFPLAKEYGCQRYEISDLKDINKFKLADYKGYFLYFNFCTQWCGPCYNNLPNTGETFSQINSLRDVYRTELPVLPIYILMEANNSHLETWKAQFMTNYSNTFMPNPIFILGNSTLFNWLHNAFYPGTALIKVNSDGSSAYVIESKGSAYYNNYSESPRAKIQSYINNIEYGNSFSIKTDYEFGLSGAASILRYNGIIDDSTFFNILPDECYDDAKEGCIDSNACNYNPFAFVDDGSCEYCGNDEICQSGECFPIVLGCTDATACNYNLGANKDDGSCEYVICKDGTCVATICDCPVSNVYIDITPDDYPHEISYVITSTNGKEIATGDSSGGYYYLTEGTYTFTINDSYGDGICCNSGKGSYRINVNGSEIIECSDECANFGESKTHEFTVGTCEDQGLVTCLNLECVNKIEDCPCSETNSITIQYNPGWNIVGLPVDVEDFLGVNIFPEATKNTLYTFNSKYVLEDSLTPGIGYWVYFKDQSNVTLSGPQINEVTINLSQGWNMISGISSKQILTDDDNIIIPDTLFGFNTSYFLSNTMEPGNGYWIRASNDGDITISLD